MAKPKTEREVVEACNELAILFYKSHGYAPKEGFKMYESGHPHEQSMWNLAVMAYDHIEGTDVEEALSNLEDE